MFFHILKDPLADPALPSHAITGDRLSVKQVPNSKKAYYGCALKDTHATKLWASKLFPAESTVNVSFRFTSNCKA